MVFRYGAINWTTGDASGGTNGFGGTVARAGWNSGIESDFFELPAAGNQAQMLNLDAANGNTNVRGLWVFQVRSGEVAGDADRLVGGAGNDRLVGGSGGDTLIGDGRGIAPGNDRFVYGRSTDRGDVIQDFQLGQDVIDLSSVLTGFTPGQSSPAGFLQVAATSLPGDDEPDIPGFNLSVDFDGGGNNFVQFAEVFGAGSNVTVDQLVSTGSVDLVPG
jgi:Ca2+-binding RTX toxin-like protein